MGDTIIPYKIFEVAIITFKVTSLERSLQVLYCSFERNHQISCSAGGRDLPIYTAGLAGAMRVKFLEQQQEPTELGMEPGALQSPDQCSNPSSWFVGIIHYCIKFYTFYLFL